MKRLKKVWQTLFLRVKKPERRPPPFDLKAVLTFYDAHTHRRESFGIRQVVKFTIRQDARTLYALSARAADGRSLTKFISQSDWEALNAPQG